MTASTYTFHQGSVPLLISLPHVGTMIPDDQQARYVDQALAVEDTDWHLETVYGFAKELGASMLVPRYSRYLIDLNRPPENTPMYAGANNTELCPTHFFSGQALYREGQAPDANEIARRRDTYWQPYHDTLSAELARLKKQHGYAILFDGHSINSVLPWLFEGQLPDLNLGTAAGSSCSPILREALAKALEAQTAFTHVADGRFKGGYITRHYGQPKDGIHAVQLEMGFRCYMQEQEPYLINHTRAAALRPVLRSLVKAMLKYTPLA
jgi:N-formylglutamate deformylase